MVNVASTADPGTASPSRLPRPEERPTADVVIFDGNCRMCSGQVRRLAGFDRGTRLAYLSLHDPEVRTRFPDLTHEALMRELHVVDSQGRRHRGASALRYLSRTLPRLWWLAPVLHFPGSLSLWQWCYRQVAAQRYRFGTNDQCTDGSCSLHSRKPD